MAINIDIIKECDVKGELGQINTSRKISVPSHISEKLVQLDQNQFNLANAINALPKNERSESIKKGREAYGAFWRSITLRLPCFF